LARDQGQQTQGLALLAEALALFRELGDQPGITQTLRRMGQVAEDQSDA
jgi:hypothetical protein